MPLVRIEVLKGRPADVKKQLLDAVHDALVEAFGIPEDDVLVVVQEPPMQNRGIRGGRSADEVELGYRLDV